MKCIYLTIKSLFLAVVAVAMVACSQSKFSKKIADMAVASNVDCPINIGDITITKIDYDSLKNNLQYHVVCNSDSFDIQKYQKSGLLLRSLTAVMFDNRNLEDTKSLLNDLLEAEAGIKYIYYDIEQNEKVECLISVNDIKSIVDVDKVDSDPDGVLNDYALRQNKDFPQALDEFTTILNVEVADTALVHHFAIKTANPDELMADLNIYLLKMNISAGLKDVTNRAILLSCIKTKRSMAYLYKVQGTDRTIDVTFSSDDLETVLSAAK